MNKVSALVVAAALALGGCIVIPAPYVKVTAPEVRGRIVDGTTQQPVPGVLVKFEGQESGGVQSGKDGVFRLPRQRDLVLGKVFTPCPVYEFPDPRRVPGALVIEKAGWKSRSFPLATYYQRLKRPSNAGTIWHPNEWDDPVLEIGDISVER